MMMFTDRDRGRAMAKDPAVVKLNGMYYLYYSMAPDASGQEPTGWGIGVSQSHNLTDWRKIGEIPSEQECEKNGICAPGAIVLDGRVHLFFQTYGNGAKDAICHAISGDGVHFVKNATNPVFSPTGEWNNGRAIDADVAVFHGKLFLYFATRDPKGEIQMQGVATAELDSGFGRDAWTQACDAPILKPELPWEQACIEAAAMCKRDGKLYMFYAGAYNNCPQQIGCAVSEDGVSFTRLFDEPLLPSGEPGSWNESESGHPFVYTDEDGRTYLFYQGNADKGKSWYLSMVEIGWRDGLPYVMKAQTPAR